MKLHSRLLTNFLIQMPRQIIHLQLPRSLPVQVRLLPVVRLPRSSPEVVKARITVVIRVILLKIRRTHRRMMTQPERAAVMKLLMLPEQAVSPIRTARVQAVSRAKRKLSAVVVMHRVLRRRLVQPQALLQERHPVL